MIRFGVHVPRDERDQLAAIVLDYIDQAYRFLPAGAREPSIGTTDVLDYLLQHGRCPNELRYATRGRQQGWVRALLRSLVAGGKLETSRGEGRRGGETRLYSPGRQR